MHAALLLALLHGCRHEPGKVAGETAADCDAAELCDGLDNDCDGEIDEEAADAATFHADADGDGHGSGAVATVACEAPVGMIADATDCDDARADVFPGAEEVCNSVDDDCDGEVDAGALDATLAYLDADGDGFGDPTAGVLGCAVPDGHVAEATDCDDGDADRHPGANESACADPVDYNCDGSVGYADADYDGWAACEDCDDAAAARNPSAAEVCDGSVDEDCDGLVDDEDPDVTGFAAWYRDADGDGWGNDALTTTMCVGPIGFAGVGGDCDDADAWRSPGLAEVCDWADLDEDCSGLADDADVGTDASTFATFARDADSDGYGDAARTVTQCDAPAGYGVEATDCDDADPALSPGEPEVCDGVDNDCDALVDDDDAVTDAPVYHSDADGDGYGDPAVTSAACVIPAGFVDNADDCDDADPAAGICPAPVDPVDTGDSGGAATSPVRFIVIADTGDGSAGQYAVASGMGVVCAAVGCDFVLMAGDNFYPGGVTSTADPLWNTAFELPYAGLDLKFWAVMGNHDWDHTLDTAYLDAQVDYSAVSSKWNMPADYYSRVVDDVTFFGIDTHVIDFGGGAAQEAWLPLERATSTTTWNLLYGHHPYVSNGPHGNATPPLQGFFDTYVCGQFDVYFCGHDHILAWHEDTCGTAFLISGAGKSTYSLGGSNPVYFEAATRGFLWVEIAGRTFTGVFYDEDGVELYRRSFTK